MERQTDRELDLVISRKSGRTLDININRDKIRDRNMVTGRDRETERSRDRETDRQRTPPYFSQENSEKIVIIH